MDSLVAFNYEMIRPKVWGMIFAVCTRLQSTFLPELCPHDGAAFQMNRLQGQAMRKSDFLWICRPQSSLV